METINGVMLGLVTTRNGARLHLSIRGRAYCGAGSGVIQSSRSALATDGDKVCKRCREAVRMVLVDILSVRERMGYRELRGNRSNTRIIHAIEALIDGMMTGGERAARAKTLAALEEVLERQVTPPRQRTVEPYQGSVASLGRSAMTLF